MHVELNYGRGKLPVELPDDLQLTVVRKPPMPVLPDPSGAVRKALQEPVGTASLDQLARAARSATIAICDVTRPVPNHLFLRPLIEILLRSGIPATSIRVLVATGLHRPNLGDRRKWRFCRGRDSRRTIRRAFLQILRSRAGRLHSDRIWTT